MANTMKEEGWQQGKGECWTGTEHYQDMDNRRCINCGEHIDSGCLTTCKKCIEAGALNKGLTPQRPEG